MPTMLGLVGVLLTLATLFAVINQKTLKLPLTIGVLLFTLVTSGLVMGLNALTPHQAFLSIPREILDTINLPSWLLDGALAILLFAGAMQVDLDHLIRRKFSIVALAILGTVLAVLLLAFAAWLIFPVLGVHVPISWCILLGAILAPTDPVSVVGMLRRLGLPPHLQAIFAGESLFNDGVGIVIFTLAIGVATGETSMVTPGDVFMGFLHEAGGGIVLGVMTGWLMLQIVRTVDDAHIHLLASLALATGTYGLAHTLGMSGPIAVVAAGMSLGSVRGRTYIAGHSREELQTFWTLIDEVFNVLLFLLIGLVIFAITPTWSNCILTLAIIPLAVLARGLSVFLSTVPMHLHPGKDRGRLLSILTWGGLRGGISVALALSLPEGALRDTLLPICYGVVVFTIFAQGLTMERVVHYLYPELGKQA